MGDAPSFVIALLWWGITQNEMAGTSPAISAIYPKLRAIS